MITCHTLPTGLGAPVSAENPKGWHIVTSRQFGFYYVVNRRGAFLRYDTLAAAEQCLAKRLTE